MKLLLIGLLLFGSALADGDVADQVSSFVSSVLDGVNRGFSSARQSSTTPAADGEDCVRSEEEFTVPPKLEAELERLGCDRNYDDVTHPFIPGCSRKVMRQMPGLHPRRSRTEAEVRRIQAGVAECVARCVGPDNQAALDAYRCDVAAFVGVWEAQTQPPNPHP